MSRGLGVLFLLLGTALSGCLTEDTTNIETGPSEVHTLEVTRDDWALTIGKQSLEATADRAQIMALRFHLQDEITLNSVKASIKGTKEEFPPWIGMWALFWKSGEGEPEPASVGIVGARYADVAVLPQTTGVDVQVDYPISTTCQVTESCEPSGFSVEFVEDVVLGSGEWWFVFGTTSHSVYDAEIRLNVGSSQIRPDEIFLGEGCTLLDAAEMGGAVRFTVFTGPTIYQDLEAVVPTRDHLFLARIGYPVDYEEELDLPNGTSYWASNTFLGDRVANWPGILYGDDLAGEVEYRMPLAVGTGRPVTLNTCTFADNELHPLDWNGQNRTDR